MKWRSKPKGFFKGDKVGELREKHKLTHANLGEDISSSRSVIWRMENDPYYAPNLNTIAKMVEVFNKEYGENKSVSDFIDPSKLRY